MSLSIADYQAAANRIGCSVAQIRAIVKEESRGEGFTRHRGVLVPKILFEPHKMYAHSGAFPISRVAPHLSRRVWIPGLYNQIGSYRVRPGEDRQHIRLEQAVALDAQFNAGGAIRDAALMSCSWGLGQVLGEQWRSLGYPSLQDFINAQYAGEPEQLDTMARFIVTNHLADDARRGGKTPDSWRGLARGYNGKSYAVHNYHGRLAKAYSGYV